MSTHFARPAVAAAVTALAIALSGCSENQSDNTAEPADTSIDNAYIVPAFDQSCALQTNAPADLSFTATNNSSTITETLQRISTPAAADVTITAPDSVLAMEPQSSIAAGQPVENTNETAAPDEPFHVTLHGVKNTLQPGKSVPVAFQFERAGTLTINVAVDACPTQKD
ncbi:uncharacterized protein DUF461 [Williamsia limnetica]|uniref:Uncharacterized protein DUF461 n=1 Tax=Williamsia limnetica TaxID=882452 RepID=A0A318RH79_WILLI|nr:copper chaperone PCu(A)C [Williamsia limnetica]PYE12732.1 uncharacterized protein DUF461 [Williamsia limnetica]